MLAVNGALLSTAPLAGEGAIEESGVRTDVGEEGLLAAGMRGGLTIAGSASRLSEAEISTGTRLGDQMGLQLRESSHIGAEYVDQGGKTYDAMGQPAAYSHWNEGQFMNSIKDHLNKSVDFVAIDLKGASKGQAGAIQKYVGGLSKEAQARIKYVR